MSEKPFGPDFDPVGLGVVKSVSTTSNLQGAHMHVTFWDRGALVVRAQLGDNLIMDVRPAPMSVYQDDEQAKLGDAHRSGLARGLAERAQEHGLYNAAREACHASGLPWTDPRTGVTHEPPALRVADGAYVRDATSREQFEAILQLAQEAHEHQGATHDCGEWRQGFRCMVCGRWTGHA